MSLEGDKTYFYNTNDELLGTITAVLPITLYKGMTITITKYDGKFEVVDWNYHHGHEDEQTGLRIILQQRQV